MSRMPVEVDVTTALGGLELIENYTYTDARVSASSDLSDPHLDRRLASIPEHSASLWVTHGFGAFGQDGFRAGAGARYVGKTWDSTDVLATAANTLVDVMFSFDYGRWRYAVNATNHFCHLSRPRRLLVRQPADRFPQDHLSILTPHRRDVTRRPPRIGGPLVGDPAWLGHPRLRRQPARQHAHLRRSGPLWVLPRLRQPRYNDRSSWRWVAWVSGEGCTPSSSESRALQRS
jgi:hypothetical protein